MASQACEEDVRLDFNGKKRISNAGVENADKDENFSSKVRNGSKQRRATLTEKVGIAFREKYFKEQNRSYNILDEYSKTIFPISFIIFNICYAGVCISVQY